MKLSFTKTFSPSLIKAVTLPSFMSDSHRVAKGAFMSGKFLCWSSPADHIEASVEIATTRVEQGNTQLQKAVRAKVQKQIVDKYSKIVGWDLCLWLMVLEGGCTNFNLLLLTFWVFVY